MTGAPGWRDQGQRCPETGLCGSERAARGAAATVPPPPGRREKGAERRRPVAGLGRGLVERVEE